MYVFVLTLFFDSVFDIVCDIVCDIVVDVCIRHHLVALALSNIVYKYNTFIPY